MKCVRFLNGYSAGEGMQALGATRVEKLTGF